MSAPSTIRGVHKTLAYIAPWLVALFATDPSCRYWPLVYMFPIGLAAFIDLHLGNDGGWYVLGVCVAIYLVHAIFYFRSRTARSTVAWFGVLIAILICNVAGCREQLPRH